MRHDRGRNLVIALAIGLGILGSSAVAQEPPATKSNSKAKSTSKAKGSVKAKPKSKAKSAVKDEVKAPPKPAEDPQPVDEPKPANVDAKPAATNISGTWVGALQIGAIELRLVVNIKTDDQQQLTATLDSPDQGANGIPVTSVSLQEGTVKFESQAVQATFEGKLSADGTTIDGQFKQGPAALPLVLKRSEGGFHLNRPQEPHAPFPYREEQVTYPSRAADVAISGTLTLPEGDGPFPAVLLISGSGPQDRDEALMGHKPFLVLADHLTRRGIAVLRCDDRGIGKSTGDFSTATSLDFTEDALGGFDFLKARSDINPTQIGMAGHSEGGLIAPLAASRCAEIAFIVLIAGPGVNGEQILYRQGADIAKASGAAEKDVEQNRRIQEKLFAVVKDNLSEEETNTRMKALLEEVEAELKSVDQATADTARSGMQAQAKMVLSPWFRLFLVHDPQVALAQVHCPVLAINGEKDLQVAASVNLAAILAGLHAAGNHDYTIRELPGLNHLLQTCETGNVSEYGKIEETMAPMALTTISDWILQRFGPQG